MGHPLAKKTLNSPFFPHKCDSKVQGGRNPSALPFESSAELSVLVCQSQGGHRYRGGEMQILLGLHYPIGIGFQIIFSCVIVVFFFFWLHWVSIVAHGLSPVAASGGYSLLWCTGFSLWWLLLLQSMGSRGAGFSSCGMWAQ